MLKYKEYEITTDGGNVRIVNTETGAEKSAKIKTDARFDIIFKCLKNQINTKYTAPELLAWFRKLIADDFCTAYITTICRAYVG